MKIAETEKEIMVVMKNGNANEKPSQISKS